MEASLSMPGGGGAPAAAPQRRAASDENSAAMSAALDQFQALLEHAPCALLAALDCAVAKCSMCDDEGAAAAAAAAAIAASASRAVVRERAQSISSNARHPAG